MNFWKKQGKVFLLIVVVFLALYNLPVGSARFDNAVLESLHLLKDYAREHTLLCLVPAFFIAGAIGVFISQGAVMKYLGPGANKFLAYGVASVSGSILAVCSCTILPLFAGIYKMGAGLGPAAAFLYSGPAINVLAIVMTARVLGPELGIARAVGAVLFSVIIGLLMHLIFRSEELEKVRANSANLAAGMGGGAAGTAGTAGAEENSRRSLWQDGLYFASMVGILVFANWGAPQYSEGLWAEIYRLKWLITSGFSLLLAGILVAWFQLKLWQAALTALVAGLLGFIYPDFPLLAFAAGLLGLIIFTSTARGELSDWYDSTWEFALQILPLLLFGVLIAGALLGRPGEEGLIPSAWVASAVGGNSWGANFFASIAGAFMYFATLTEVPILEGLIGSGMGKGPALALLLAGPALSLPNMLVIRSVMGTKKTLVFVTLVIVMATISGIIFGAIYS